MAGVPGPRGRRMPPSSRNYCSRAATGASTKALKMHSNGVECTDSALNVHGESTNSESMARLDEQQRKVLDMLVQNGPMKSSSIADQLGVQKKTCDRHTE